MLYCVEGKYKYRMDVREKKSGYTVRRISPLTVFNVGLYADHVVRELQYDNFV